MDFEAIVIGGGIQGVGILHDLASRQIKGVHLIEERSLSIGTSSKSTKLLHGGLRYLEHISQWNLVREALRERKLLLELLGEVVKPLPFVLPVYQSDRPGWMIKLGLSLYDLLAGDSGLPSARRISSTDFKNLAPYVQNERIKNDLKDAFLFYDGQMLDDVIVRLAAAAATCFGATYQEHSRVEEVTPLPSGGYLVNGMSSGCKFSFKTKILLVATGAWNNWNLIKWGFSPRVPCILNAGSHLVYGAGCTQAPPDQCAATLIQNKDGRVLFFIPWFGKWLFGTTEHAFKGDPRTLKPSASELQYLKDAAQENFCLIDPEKHLEEVFCGVRTMPIETHRDSSHKKPVTSAEQSDPFNSQYYLEATPEHLARLSRESVVSEILPGFFTLYGGKYTTYRAQSEQIGRRVKELLGKGSVSLTHTRDAWFLEQIKENNPELFTSSRELRSA